MDSNSDRKDDKSYDLGDQEEGDNSQRNANNVMGDDTEIFKAGENDDNMARYQELEAKIIEMYNETG